MPLTVEMRHQAEPRWIEVGRPLNPGDQPGSISHAGPAGRQVYLFACYGTYSTLERSQAGVDAEVGSDRLISSAGLEQIARLSADNPQYECWVNPGLEQPVRIRFTHTSGER